MPLEQYSPERYTDMGIKMTRSPDKAAYVIQCAGNFKTIEHPVEKTQGIQLALRFIVTEVNGKEVLIDMRNDPRKSTCFVGNSMERQMAICANKAFRQMKQPLHEKIQAMVGKLVGRKMDDVISDNED